jgi:hypothetical protein
VTPPSALQASDSNTGSAAPQASGDPPLLATHITADEFLRRSSLQEDQVGLGVVHDADRVRVGPLDARKSDPLEQAGQD